MPPTLTHYVGLDRIDLQKLVIPRQVIVTADIPESARKEKPDDAVFKVLDDFAARQRAAPQPAPAPQKQSAITGPTK